MNIRNASLHGFVMPVQGRIFCSIGKKDLSMSKEKSRCMNHTIPSMLSNASRFARYKCALP